ncbi:SseB family protein [Micromonospora sp. NPDC126480]|uniref:SseB family protein n=1 Tax=Micromonospora sp. NPDC126480 TaxID=3155312 RepID=UPI00332E5130
MDTGRGSPTPADRWPPPPVVDRPGQRPADPDAPTNGRPPGDADRPNHRSFFEPASSQASREERAVPPPRFARGGQPFPRRRPLTDPPAEASTQAFPAGDASRAGPARAFAAPAEETSRAPQRATVEEARTVRFPVPDPATLQAYARRTPDGDPTQALPRRRPAPPPADPEPASVAEPVSGPPAPRRGFTPIVIEGTIVESRDLTVPPVPGPPGEVREGAQRPVAEPGWLAGDGIVPPPEVAEPVVPPPAAYPRPAAPPGPGEVSPAAVEPVAPPPAAYQRPATPPGPGGVSPAAVEPVVPSPAAYQRPAARPAAEPAVPAAAGPVTPPDGEPSAGPDRQAVSGPAGAAPDLPAAAPATAGPASAPTGEGPVDDASAPTLADPAAAPTSAAPIPVAPTQAAPIPAAQTDPASPDPVAAAPTTADPADVAVPAPADVVAAPATAGPMDAAGPPVTARTGPLDSVSGAPPVGVPADFEPANEVEEDLVDATGSGSTDTFLSTLLLARVLLPVAPDSAPGSRPGEPGFVWRTEELDGEKFVVVYTSPERLADHTDAALETVRIRFVQLIHRWPDRSWSFAVNPGTPIGAKLPGEQIVGLANWAAEVGLRDDAGPEPEAPAAATAPAERPRYEPSAADPTRPVVMQKAVAPSQLAYYLERGYDRVSGFVHRAGELAHLTTPAQLYEALGLGYPDSPFDRAAEEIYVLRWPAHRPSLYRIPYGGQNEPAMRAMEGWVIERPPFRGNGFAPGEGSDVVAEFKVDSARLPHGAQLWRIGADGTERVVATLDADALLWRTVGDE